MKRLLLAPLLLTLLFGCSNKNDIINLKCTMDQRQDGSNVFRLIDPYKPFAIIDITINTKNKKASFFDSEYLLFEQPIMVDKIFLSSDYIEIKSFYSEALNSHISSDKGDWDSKTVFKINRINGEIIYSFEYSSNDAIAIYKGECYVPEDVETLF